MSYTLDALIKDCQAALAAGETKESLERVKAALEGALADVDFLAQHLGPQNTTPRRVLYEDQTLGFAICAHVYTGAAMGEPHDHGPTWAIYGQAEGVTKMTDWQILEPATEKTPAKVTLKQTYQLSAGEAHIYPTGAVHAPLREGPTRLLRIEGINTDKVTRTKLVKVESA